MTALTPRMQRITDQIDLLAKIVHRSEGKFSNNNGLHIMLNTIIFEDIIEKPLVSWPESLPRTVLGIYDKVLRKYDVDIYAIDIINMFMENVNDSQAKILALKDERDECQKQIEHIKQLPHTDNMYAEFGKLFLKIEEYNEQISALKPAYNEQAAFVRRLVNDIANKIDEVLKK